MLPPLIVTALSVEFGSISLATWMDAPVISLISLIFDPPFPIKDPHWDAGTISLNVTGGLGTLPLLLELLLLSLESSLSLGPSSSNFLQIMLKLLKMASVDPRSPQEGPRGPLSRRGPW